MLMWLIYQHFLDKQDEMQEDFVPTNLFMLVKRKGKQSSAVTVFSLWNTMMGTSLLALAWGISQAGFGLGIALTVFMAILSYYTCSLILQDAIYLEQENNMKELTAIARELEAGIKPKRRKKQSIEFIDICHQLLGRWGQFTAAFFSIIVLIGASVVYWIFMSNFLFNFVHYIYNAASKIEIPVNASITVGTFCPASFGMDDMNYGNFSAENALYYQLWDRTRTVPLFLGLILFPLCCMKSPTFFTKFTSLGTVSCLYLIFFVCIKAYFLGFNTNFQDESSIHYAPQINIDFPSLTGMLNLAFFLHNILLTILRNQEKPENNMRDLGFAYVAALCTYLIMGVTFYLTFPYAKSCITAIFLDNFISNDSTAFIARAALLFQIMVVFPLIAYLLRSQVYYLVYKSAHPSYKHILIFNVFLIGLCILVAIFYPNVGVIIRFVGAICGMVYVFTLPCLCHMIRLKRQKKLTWISALFHSFIIVLGSANLIAQFLI
ncbi:Sodium-coupled neutral amino acid transporter 9-like protein [Trichoplax sp. H2]|nr:Sodium-coupled neutral amino acid transporter 9-like protein [Trichoplax sp. H2]|eukprot:RDD46502.1 Sodium-coupled neutral amino acid transporter 9-like protein [Trichoplax sp. H2]